jgi:2-polyprenyl-3-methyl-5-hydroxy-6-metoxy-1,4-benzoquinol methylase
MAARHPAQEWAGCDFAAEAAATARAMHPASGIGFFWIPTIEDLESCGPFSTVIASEVIEHVQDDRAFLAGLVKAARYRVVLTTPTIDAQDPGHVRLYALGTLMELLSQYRATIEQDDNFFYVKIEVGP